MSPKKPNINIDNVDESTRIAVYLTLKKFCDEEDEKEYSFPSSLNKHEKNYIRQLITGMELKCKNEYKDMSQVLTIFKDNESTIMEKDAQLELSVESQKLLKEALNQFPLTEKEKQDLTPFSEREKNPYLLFETRNYSRTVSKLKSSIPLIPPKASLGEEQSELKESREKLPIAAFKDEIVASIQNHQVTLLTGPPGIGKTTQVPQYILEWASEAQTPVRIICTEPRRFAVISISERVSLERGEPLGTTVGFQIRLESMTSPKTALYFCTYGILLRSLMSEVEPFLHSITHIILDEVNERSLNSDFLLTILREHLNKLPNIKLILISATPEVDFLTKYFSGLRHVNVPDFYFPVEELFLEDIIRKTNYSTPEMKSYSKFRKIEPSDDALDLEIKVDANDDDKSEIIDNQNDQSDELREEIDDALYIAFTHESREKFEAAYRLILDSNCSINYQHSSTGVNLLMIGVTHGYADFVENLLLNGADLSLRENKNGWTAIEFAEAFGQSETKRLLTLQKKDAYIVSNSKEDQFNEVFIYQACHPDETDIDMNLILEVIKYICSLPETEDESKNNSILVFLPGYDEISTLWAMLINESHLSVFCLHSWVMECRESVFKRALPGKRKVILSTNIAETSVTINDVAYVIDSGRDKEIFNGSSSNVVHLKNAWISKSSVHQRRGRACRTRHGYYFGVYTRLRYAKLVEGQTPEMTRCPLVEIALQCKLLAPSNTSTVEFLSKCPDPPPTASTRAAIRTLRELEALSPSNEEVTELGNHLLDLPVEPYLGKMLLYAVTLKCLDPVLTIVCCLSCPEPFIPTQNQRDSVDKRKLKFSAGTFSDHMVRLRVFQAWQKAIEEDKEDEFCRDTHISSSVMNTITGLRSQLLGHLRASGFVRPRGWGDIKSLNQYSDNWALIKGVLIAGYYPNLARFDKGARRLKTAKEKRVNLHPSCVLSQSGLSKALTVSEAAFSAMNNTSTEWLIFDRLINPFSSSPMLQCVTPVSPIAVLLFAGPNRLSSENMSDYGFVLDDSSDSESDEGHNLDSSSVLKIDEWTAFNSSESLIHTTMYLKQKLSALFLRRLQHPKKTISHADDFVIKVCAEVLSYEDGVLGLEQPSGIGQKPRTIEAFRQSFLGCCETEITEENGSDELQTSGAAASGSSLSRSLNPFILRSFKFFIIKATCAQAIEISLYRGVWQFGNQTEKKLLKAVKQSFSPVIIFSIHGSGHFQGFAKFVGNPSLEHIPELVSQSSGSGSGTQYIIQWIRFSPLPFSATRHLINPYNNRQVQSSRDGQEIEPGVGDSLCRLWDVASPHHGRKRGSFFNGPSTNNNGVSSNGRGTTLNTSPSLHNKKSYVRY